DFISDDPLTDVVLVGQTQVLFGGDVAKHGGAGLSRQRGPDRRGDVVVTWCDIGDQGTENIEWRFVADLPLLFDVHLNQVHGNVSRSLDHDLAAVFPGFQG